MNLITELVQSTLMTGRLSNEGLSPVSIILIAPPEHGKTSILVEESCESLLLMNDLTGSGLRKVIGEMEKVTHVALLDMLMLTAHATKANKFLMANVAMMTEEGFMGEAVPGSIQINEKPIRKGFICCMTGSMINDGRVYWNRSGITSRLLPFYYCYSKELTEQIREAINTCFDKPITIDDKHLPVADLRKFKVPAEPVFVKISQRPKIAIEQLARDKSLELTEEIDPKGFRRLKQFRSLACGHAMLRGWKHPEVNQKDVDFLKRIYPYISYTRPCEI